MLCGFDMDTSMEEPGMLDYSKQSLEEYLATTLEIMKSADTAIYDALPDAIPTSPPQSAEPHASFPRFHQHRLRGGYGSGPS